MTDKALPPTMAEVEHMIEHASDTHQKRYHKPEDYRPPLGQVDMRERAAQPVEFHVGDRVRVKKVRETFAPNVQAMYNGKCGRIVGLNIEDTDGNILVAVDGIQEAMFYADELELLPPSTPSLSSAPHADPNAEMLHERAAVDEDTDVKWANKQIARVNYMMDTEQPLLYADGRTWLREFIRRFTRVQGDRDKMRKDCDMENHERIATLLERDKARENITNYSLRVAKLQSDIAAAKNERDVARGDRVAALKACKEKENIADAWIEQRDCVNAQLDAAKKEVAEFDTFVLSQEHGLPRNPNETTIHAATALIGRLVAVGDSLRAQLQDEQGHFAAAKKEIENVKAQSRADLENGFQLAAELRDRIGKANDERDVARAERVNVSRALAECEADNAKHQKRALGAELEVERMKVYDEKKCFGRCYDDGPVSTRCWPRECPVSSKCRSIYYGNQRAIDARNLLEKRDKTIAVRDAEIERLKSLPAPTTDAEREELAQFCCSHAYFHEQHVEGTRTPQTLREIAAALRAGRAVEPTILMEADASHGYTVTLCGYSFRVSIFEYTQNGGYSLRVERKETSDENPASPEQQR